MLAANRIANVPGRIILLIVSIITITGINILGVPLGTKWDINLLNWLITDHNIHPNQIGKAKNNVNTKWLDLVKIYGNNPIKLENKIKKKIVIKIFKTPLKT